MLAFNCFHESFIFLLCWQPATIVKPHPLTFTYFLLCPTSENHIVACKISTILVILNWLFYATPRSSFLILPPEPDRTYNSIDHRTQERNSWLFSCYFQHYQERFDTIWININAGSTSDRGNCSYCFRSVPNIVVSCSCLFSSCKFSC